MMNKLHLGLLHAHCRDKCNHSEETHIYMYMEDSDTVLLKSFQRKCRQMLCAVFSAKRPYFVEGMGNSNATIEFYFLDVKDYVQSVICFKQS